MKTISELAKSIKEENLSKDQLEHYYTELTSLSADMELSLADLKKAEAIFLNESGEKTRAGAERIWKATEKGQEQISLTGNIRAIDKLRSSIKSRMYQSY
jgi:hypothetical protein